MPKGLIPRQRREKIKRTCERSPSRKTPRRTRLARVFLFPVVLGKISRKTGTYRLCLFFHERLKIKKHWYCQIDRSIWYCASISTTNFLIYVHVIIESWSPYASRELNSFYLKQNSYDNMLVNHCKTNRSFFFFWVRPECNIM